MKGPIKKYNSWKALIVKKPKMKKPESGGKPKNIGEGMDSPGGPKTPGAKGTYK